MLPTLVLLPGMDGTGELFADFINTLPATFHTEVVRYPRDRFLSSTQLADTVGSAMPSDTPFILVAESFSTPLATRLAANNPPNLVALVICAGFITSPIRGWKRWIFTLVAPIVFRLPVTSFLVGHFLLGPSATKPLLAAVQAAIASVKPKVLSARLRAILACDARTELAQVGVPILYLQAEHDRLVPGSCLEEMRRIKPTMIVETIDAPHLLLQREPEQSAEIVVRFTWEILKEGVKWT
jgi:pimeloyl-[acyl-carrier protein] methyl ester esterase